MTDYKCTNTVCFSRSWDIRTNTIYTKPIKTTIWGHLPVSYGVCNIHKIRCLIFICCDTEGTRIKSLWWTFRPLRVPDSRNEFIMSTKFLAFGRWCFCLLKTECGCHSIGEGCNISSLRMIASPIAFCGIRKYS